MMMAAKLYAETCRGNKDCNVLCLMSAFSWYGNDQMNSK